MLILQGVGGLGQRLGMVILWGRERGGWGTDIRDFIFWEGWFRAGGLWANIGDVNNGAGGRGFGDRYRAVYSIGGGRVLGQRLGMLIL